MSPSKAGRLGAETERMAQDNLRVWLGVPKIRRALGAGRTDDVGDMDGVPHTCIQVTAIADLVTAIRIKLPAVEQQRKNRRVPFAAVLIRRRRSKTPWLFVLSPEMYAKLWKYAVLGYESERRARIKDRDQRTRELSSDHPELRRASVASRSRDQETSRIPAQPGRRLRVRRSGEPGVRSRHDDLLASEDVWVQPTAGNRSRRR